MSRWHARLTRELKEFASREHLEPFLITVVAGYAVILVLEVYTVHVRDFFAGRTSGLVLFGLFVSAVMLLWFSRRSQQRQATHLRITQLMILVLIGLGLLVHTSSLVHYWPQPQLNDIAGRTLFAIEAVQQGNNPYDFPVPWREALTQEYFFQHSGYVYMPLMIAVYLPLVSVFNAQGIILTNLLLFLASAVLVFRIAQRLGSPMIGLWATALYVHLPLVRPEIYNIGVTDLAAVVPLLIAAALWPPYLLWSGLALGLSMSVKLFPALIALPLLFPRAGWKKFSVGLILGLTPIWLFLLVEPMKFLASTTLFSFVRAADSTSLQYTLGVWYAQGAQATMAFLLGIATLFTWRSNVSLTVRLGLYLVVTLGVLLAGPANHANYQLWWLPFYCVLFALVLVCSNVRTPALATTAADTTNQTSDR